MTDYDPSAQNRPGEPSSGTPEPGDAPDREQPSPWAAPGRAAQSPDADASAPGAGAAPQPSAQDPAAQQPPGEGQPQRAQPAAEPNPYAVANPQGASGTPGGAQDDPRGAHQAGHPQSAAQQPQQQPQGTQQAQGAQPQGAQPQGAQAQQPQGAHYAQHPLYPTATYPTYSTAEGGAAPGRQRGPFPRKLFAAVALVALLVGGGAGAAGGYLAGETAEESNGVNALDQTPPAEQTSDAPEGSVQAVAEKLMPSVVQLQVRGGNAAGEGSGFVLSEDGYIMTNNHVIEAATNGGQITVVFQNGNRANAEVVGRDPTTDIAVVKAQGVNGLRTVELGRSDNLSVGEQVVAIGSPFDLAGTVTSGIVSSLHRPVTAGGQGDQTTVMDAIQTDAAINPGNSGGPLANRQGQVIGINSAIYSPQQSGGPGAQTQGGNVGIGFAIPIDQARRTADEIIEKGYATQTFIGAVVGNAQSGGALIRDVQPGAPAAKAGLKSGDVIVKMGDRRIEDANTLVAAIRTRAPGQQVTFTLADGGTVEATLGGQRVEAN